MSIHRYYLPTPKSEGCGQVFGLTQAVGVNPRSGAAGLVCALLRLPMCADRCDTGMTALSGRSAAGGKRDKAPHTRRIAESPRTDSTPIRLAADSYISRR
ncbi:MAG: hypothetical protein IJ906_03895 [Oscillospiraceae bacterium]|nr:hypothetical protein [Oscillospiraceae bacterium]